MSLIVSEVSFTYPGIPSVLRDISLAAEAGRILAIIGPNAVGKTTLLRIMLGLLKAESGSVALDGKQIDKMTLTERAAKCAYVAQRSTVDAPFTVYEVMKLGLNHVAPKYINQAMESVGIEHLANRIYQQLSVGQQQRIAFARASAQIQNGSAGTALLLDEPMSALDPKYCINIISQLRQIASRGSVVVVVIHDLPLAYRFADDVALLHDGGLFAAGTVEDTLHPENLEAVFGIPFMWARYGLDGDISSRIETDSPDQTRVKGVPIPKMQDI